MGDIFENVPGATLSEPTEQGINIDACTDDELISTMLDETEERPEWQDFKDKKQHKLPDFDDDPDAENVENIEAEELHKNRNVQKMDFNSIMSLDVVIDCIDTLFLFGIAKFCKIPDSDIHDVATSDKEKKSLSKAAKNYLDSQDIAVTPLQGLLFAFGSVYVPKFIICKQMSKQIKELQAELDKVKKDVSKE